MAIGSNNVTVLERQDTVTLRGLPRNPVTKKGGGITVELQPRKGWREKAEKGLLSLQYRVSARAEIEMSDGTKQMRSINAFFPAVGEDNQLLSLGEYEGKSFFRLNENGSTKTHLVSGAAPDRRLPRLASPPGCRRSAPAPRLRRWRRSTAAGGPSMQRSKGVSCVVPQCSQSLSLISSSLVILETA